MLVAWAVLAFSPAHVESPLIAPAEGAVGMAGLAMMLVVNLVLLRRAFSPLSRLTALTRRVDPLRPGPRLPVYGADPEVLELTQAFNDMVERLERERQESSGRALRVQEAERRRLARELHDEIGQRLTAVLLQLEHTSRRMPGEVATDLAEVRETTRASLEEVRRVLRQLRPEALEDLGLASALSELGDRMSSEGDLRVVRTLDPQLPELTPEAELAIYRVAQEGLTNAVRHAQASTVELHLERSPGGVRLRLVDDGRGMDGASEGGGLRGLRERALLIGARLELKTGPTGGVEISLDVPAERASG
jgi:two-component system sensor histidine kinase UhpB